MFYFSIQYFVSSVKARNAIGPTAGIGTIIGLGIDPCIIRFIFAAQGGATKIAGIKIYLAGIHHSPDLWIGKMSFKIPVKITCSYLC